MKMKLAAAMALAVACGSAWSQWPARVDGYVKKDGTYVSPYYRTAPNNNIYDNYSTRGNVNPYTGEKGYVAPDSYYGRPRSYQAPQIEYANPYRSPTPSTFDYEFKPHRYNAPGSAGTGF